MLKTTLTRSDLYNLMWSQTMSVTAEQLGISYQSLRKICIENNIPIPQTGYWSKLRFAKKTRKTPLPIGEDLKLKMPGQSEFQLIINEIRNDAKANYKVPLKLRKPHPLIQKFKASPKVKEGYIANGWVSRSLGDLAIDVSRKNKHRAIRIMDTIIKLLEHRGHKVTLGPENTLAHIFDESISIRITEPRKRSKPIVNTWRSFDLIPKGKLNFQFGPNYLLSEIKEGKETLEDKVPKIIASLEVYANEQQALKKEREIRRSEQEEERRIAKDLKMRKEEEFAKTVELFQHAKRYLHAKLVRDYIKKMKSKKDSDWEIWANEKVDWYDPFVEKEGPILDLSFRDKLDTELRSYNFI